MNKIPVISEGNAWPQLPHQRMFIFYLIAASVVLEKEKMQNALCC